MSDQPPLDAYEFAEQAINEVAKMEQAAQSLSDPMVTIQMPLRVAIEVLATVSIKLQMNERSVNSSLRNNQLADEYQRTEIDKLRAAIDAFRAAFKEPSTANPSPEPK